MTVTNMGRFLANANGAALTSGVMTAVAVSLPAGYTVKKITFASATTAMATPAHWGFALFNGNVAAPTLMGATADQLTAAWAANTEMPLNLATAQVIPKAGIYYFGVWAAAATVPTLLSATAFPAGLLSSIGLLAGEKSLAVTSGSGLTTAPPATIVTGGTNSLVVPWVAIN